ncbi:MAG: DUF3048 domain-containing protein [Candidatus Nanopelagicales bacterium]
MRAARPTPRLLTAATAAALVLGLAGCSSGGGAAPVAASPSAPSSASTAPSPTPTPTPERTVGPDASPLSGRPGGAGKPVLVVKLDNTTFAQPHTGLTKADVVYVEEVEFGLTRLAAVFSSQLPKVVGPVRSARISDIDLLGQYGRPAFAYSGSQQRMHPLLAAASLYDVSGDKGAKGWFRESGRRPPWNFMGRPKLLLERAPKASTSKDIGFVFDYATPDGGTPVKKVTARYPDSQAQFVWNPSAKAFDVRLNKRPARATEGGTQKATTVVIQYVKQYDSGFGDKYGGRTPKEETIGTGKGLVLRDGQSWPVTWTRNSRTEGTLFVGEDGQVVPFQPGQVWVVLVNRTKPVVVTR